MPPVVLRHHRVRAQRDAVAMHEAVLDVCGRDLEAAINPLSGRESLPQMFGVLRRMGTAIEPDGAIGATEEPGDRICDEALGLRIDDGPHAEVGARRAHRVGHRVRAALPLEQRVHRRSPALRVLPCGLVERDAHVLADFNARITAERQFFVIAEMSPTTCRRDPLAGHALELRRRSAPPLHRSGTSGPSSFDLRSPGIYHYTEISECGLWIVSERSSLSRLPIEFHREEVVAVGHLDLRQSRRIEDGVLVDHFVEKQHIGRCGVNLVWRQRSRFRRRHRPVDEVPDRRRIRHEASLDLHWLGIAKWDEAAMQSRARAVGSVTRLALLRVDGSAVFHGAASLWQLLAGGGHRRVACLDLLCVRCRSKAIGGSLREDTRRREEHDRRREQV